MDKKTLEICEKLLLSRVQYFDARQRTCDDEFVVYYDIVKSRYESALLDVQLALRNYD